MELPNPDRLLDRPPLPLDPIPEGAFAGRTVLVTGAGGSVGSALCAGLRDRGAKTLVLLDRSAHRLAAAARGRGVHAIHGDAGDGRLLDGVLGDFRPDLVFHAAASKHVAHLESRPLVAFRDNVLVTRVLARAAERHGVARFVFLSTDKAADPAGVMGASKRMAEMLGEGRFASLRLGNVLGSSGSVLPRMARRIRAGHALSITHPEARRYFLTSGEAVAFLLHAALVGRPGDVLVPDLGEPVRIVDLARRLQAAMGREVPIRFTGLRPGEKLEERLHGASERLEPTGTRGLFRAVEAR